MKRDMCDLLYAGAKRIRRQTSSLTRCGRIQSSKSLSSFDNHSGFAMRSRASHSGAIFRRGLREAASRKPQLRPIAQSWPPTMGNEFKEGGTQEGERQGAGRFRPFIRTLVLLFVRSHF